MFTNSENSAIFFFFYILICEFLAVNLFVFVLVQEFEESIINEDNPIQLFEELEEVFFRTWKQFTLSSRGLWIDQN